MYTNPGNGLNAYGYSSATSTTVKHYIPHGMSVTSQGSVTNGRRPITVDGYPGKGTIYVKETDLSIDEPIVHHNSKDYAFGNKDLKTASSCFGRYVQNVQLIMGCPTDGLYGPYTENAVKNFQNAFGLTPDGIVGPNTKSKMWSEYSGTITSRGF